MRQLSVAIITWNEEKKIGRALASVAGLADEIVVVDSFSTDGTEGICRRYTDRFLSAEWQGYRTQKQFALEHARHEWVLSLDADEALSNELILELETWKRLPETGIDGHLLPRLTFFMGRWIRHTSWHPDRQLRLFRKSRGKWVGGRVHESVQVTGHVTPLQHAIEHYTYSDTGEYLSQLQNFSSLAAADYFDAGRKSNLLHLVFYPLAEFWRNYLLRRGFQDGVPGLVVSILSSISVFFRFLKLWELQNQTETGKTSSQT